MNSYTFPDHIPISDPARNLITKILNLDPTKRPTLDEILAHPFINSNTQIPSTLPLSTLACPPSANYIKQFQNFLMADQKTNENPDPVVIIEEKNNKANGDQVIRKYMSGKLLGKGGFAKCYEITNMENKKT